jgi:predicted nucleic acid-binding protein
MMLVDSTLYISWLRARQDPQRLLEPWLRASQVCCCGIVQVEVLRGIVDARG